MKNKQHRLTFLLGFLLSSIIISAQVRVVDNKGTILQIDSSKWAIGTNGVDIYNKNMNNSGKVGIGTKTPVATLHNTGSTLLGTSNLSDFAADVAIGTAAATVDAFTAFNIPQATAGITLTLPSPTANTAGRMVFVSNTGSVPLTVGTTLVTVGNTIQFIWNGTSWAPSATPLKWYAENLSAPATAPVATGAGSIALGDGAMAETGDMFVYGNSAGAGATGADNSNFIGSSAGNGATDASNSNFMGSFAGNGAINANESNMLGSGSGTNATFAGNSNFLGYNAGANATNASQSNFLGNSAGANATDADNSNFLGFNAGQDAANASFSNLLGYKAGRSFASNNIGSNNIIIGTNISLPDATANAINLGGVLFGTGTNSTVIGDPVVAPVAGGKIGIGTNTPGSTLDVKGTLRLSGSTSGYVGFAPAAAAGSTTYTLPSADGTTGQMLTTNGAGVLSWATNASWSLTGNAGTTAGTNFVGTTDDVDLVFKRNGLEAGRLGGDNTSFGVDALASSTTGLYNVAVGTGALSSNTAATDNTAVGSYALFTNSTGNYNVAVGSNALSNSTADDNTAVGSYTLSSNSTGISNVAVGSTALYTNTTGGNNVAVGFTALNQNVSGGYNTAVGNFSLQQNTANNNTAVGYSALLNNTTGTPNVAVGQGALTYNTTGANNVAVGYQALNTQVSVNDNTAVGYQALYKSTGGTNTSVGSKALYNTTSGTNNTAIGYQAGINLTTGGTNIVIGSGQNLANNTASNQLNIGGLIFGTGLTGTQSAPAGNAGIGTTAPTARLHLPAGTATAGTAPLKLTSGTNLATTEAGAIEYNGSHLYFTAVNAGTRYQLDQQTQALSALTAATAANTIDNTNYAQTWNWNTLAAGNGLSLNAASTAAASNTQTVLNVATSGANATATQTTYGAKIANTHTGTTSTNVGLSVSASGGTNNYGLLVSSGNVGIGTTAPGSALDVKGTLRLSGSTSGYVGFAPAAAAGSTTYTLPSADGSSGQALTTNGAGTLSWAAPTASLTLGSPSNGADNYGATYSGGTLTLKYATDTYPGIVSTGAQTFAGAKTFNGNITVASTIASSGGSDLTINAGLGTGNLQTAGTNRLVWNSTSFYPNTDNSYNLGGSSNRWVNVYAKQISISGTGYTISPLDVQGYSVAATGIWPTHGSYAAGAHGDTGPGSDLDGVHVSAYFSNRVFAESYDALSDEREKENIATLNDSVCYDAVKSVRAASYNWASPDKDKFPKLGFIAQEVEKKVAEAVTPEQGKVYDKNVGQVVEVNDKRVLDYNMMTAVNWAATRKLIQKVEVLENENAALQSENAALKSRLEAIEKKLGL